MIEFGKHLRDERYIYIDKYIIDTSIAYDYRGMAGDGKWVYSMEAILSQSYRTGWKGKPPGITSFAECYGDITIQYLKQKALSRETERINSLFRKFFLD